MCIFRSVSKIFKNLKCPNYAHNIDLKTMKNVHFDPKY